jgi:ribosomal protein S18 acetylase RimI-like enzyme
MAVNVRNASVTDLGVIIWLNQVVQNLHAALYPEDFKEVADPSAVGVFFAGRLTDPNCALGIAEADGVPVGYVWFELQVRPETPFTPSRRRIYVHHVSVAPEARRRGIATALFHFVEQRAASENIREIALHAWAANLDAQHFFGSLGFVPLRMGLRKSLSEVR